MLHRDIRTAVSGLCFPCDGAAVGQTITLGLI